VGLLSRRPNALTFPSACGDALSSMLVGILGWAWELWASGAYIRVSG